MSMHSRPRLRGLRSIWAQQRLLDIGAGIVRAPAIEGDVAAFAAEHDGIARLTALAQRHAHRALAARVAVIDRGIDVQPQLQGAAHRSGVERVGFRVVSSQVRADADAASRKRAVPSGVARPGNMDRGYCYSPFSPSFLKTPATAVLMVSPIMCFASGSPLRTDFA